MDMEKSRVHFDKLVKMYNEYILLYKFFNYGSLKGRTDFADFYWRQHYIYRHNMRRWNI